MRVRDGEDDEEEWTEEDELDADAVELGPDERDMDLIDGSWEERYYAGRTRQRDWTNVYIGIGIIVVVSMLLPTILVLTR